MLGPCRRTPSISGQAFPGQGFEAVPKRVFALAVEDGHQEGLVADVAVAVAAVDGHPALVVIAAAIVDIGVDAAQGARGGGCIPITAPQGWNVLFPDVVLNSVDRSLDVGLQQLPDVGQRLRQLSGHQANRQKGQNLGHLNDLVSDSIFH